MTSTDFSNKVVVITDGARGLGVGLARRFGSVSAGVIITGTDSAEGSRASDSLRHEGFSASFEPLDVRDPEQSAALVDKIVRERGQIDVWVNHAEAIHTGVAETLPRESWDDSLAVILSGSFYCAQAVGQHMLARGKGVIVNVASVNAYQVIEGYAAYSAAKAGLVMLTQALGIEWAKRGVRVIGVAPGIITPDEASRNAYQRRTPLQRIGAAEEIADAVLYLASDQASYIVAETMRVDGGWLAYQLF